MTQSDSLEMVKTHTKLFAYKMVVKKLTLNDMKPPHEHYQDRICRPTITFAYKLAVVMQSSNDPKWLIGGQQEQHLYKTRVKIKYTLLWW